MEPKIHILMPIVSIQQPPRNDPIPKVDPTPPPIAIPVRTKVGHVWDEEETFQCDITNRIGIWNDRLLDCFRFGPCHASVITSFIFPLCTYSINSSPRPLGFLLHLVPNIFSRSPDIGLVSLSLLCSGSKSSHGTVANSALDCLTYTSSSRSISDRNTPYHVLDHGQLSHLLFGSSDIDQMDPFHRCEWCLVFVLNCQYHTDTTFLETTLWYTID